jgi:hypothetical protein
MSPNLRISSKTWEKDASASPDAATTRSIEA